MSKVRRSYWGWGTEDRLPGRDEQDRLIQMASALLRTQDLTPMSLPSLDGVELPTPRVQPPAQLAAMTDASPRARASHTYGKGFRDIALGFRGDFRTAPDFVCAPTSEQEVTRALEVCGDAGIAVIPYGGGTSVVGGVEADVGAGVTGAMSLDVSGLAGVIELDDVSLCARIRGGTTGPAIEEQLRQTGHTLRHFPQSFEFSTLGGWIATRAGGHFSTRYTHIDDLVQSVRMVTPRGLWESRPLPASGAGPSPDRIALGSEGTLGVITEAWMRVRPRPRFRSHASVRFRDFAAAVAAVREIAQARLYPAECRLLDAREAMLHRVVLDGSSVLLLGFESAHNPVTHLLDLALEVARGHGGEAQPAEHRDTEPGGRDDTGGAWKRAFIDAPYLLNTAVSVGAIVDTFETACTWAQFEALHQGVVRAAKDAMKRVSGGGLISCRFTHVYPDGPAPYYTFIAPGNADDGGLAQWREIKAAVSDALITHGGTITHHHAVGRLHKPWYERQVSALVRGSLAALKAHVDPAGVLNPGVLIDPQ